MQSLSAAQLVGVWERGVGQSSLDRALTMLADAYPEMTRAELAALSVGERDARLLALRERLFGGALKRTTEVVEHREGGDPSTGRKSPGRTKYEAISLERGVTHDKEFENWANKVWNFGTGLGAEVSLKDFRKDVIIEMYNEAGQLAIAYKVFRCWVSEFQAQPDLDANANAIAIQSIKLENEGWVRDIEVPEPTEPSFNAAG